MSPSGGIRLAHATGSDGRTRPGHWRTADNRFFVTRENAGWLLSDARPNHGLLVTHGLAGVYFRTRREALEALQRALTVQEEQLEIAESVLTSDADALTEYADGSHHNSCWCNDVLLVSCYAAYRLADIIAWVDRVDLARLGADQQPGDDEERELDDDELLERALRAIDPPPDLFRGLDYGRAGLREIAGELARWAADETDDDVRHHLLRASEHLNAAVDEMHGRGGRKRARKPDPDEDWWSAARDPSGLREWVEDPDRMPEALKLDAAADVMAAGGSSYVSANWVGDILVVDDNNFTPGSIYFYSRAEMLDWVDAELESMHELIDEDPAADTLFNAFDSPGYPTLSEDDVRLVDARLREIATGLARRARDETDKEAKRHLIAAADHVAASPRQ